MKTSRNDYSGIDPTRILGIVSSILVAILMLYMVQSYDFRVFEFVEYNVEYVKASAGTVGSEVTQFLWTRRTIDLILQAVLLFTTIVCCIAMLRAEERR